MKTKPTLTYCQLKNDTLDFLIWKTIKVINKYFDGNPHTFYDTFRKWNKINNLNAKERGIVWKNMRTINKFIGIDISLAKSITNKQLNIFIDLEKNGNIKIFNNGNLHWTNSKKQKMSQCYNKKYIPNENLICMIYESNKQNQYIDFEICNFSKRLLKFIAKNFEQKIDNSDIDDTPDEHTENTENTENTEHTENVEHNEEQPKHTKHSFEMKNNLNFDVVKMREINIQKYKLANKHKEPTDEEIEEIVDAVDFLKKI